MSEAGKSLKVSTHSPCPWPRETLSQSTVNSFHSCLWKSLRPLQSLSTICGRDLYAASQPLVCGAAAQATSALSSLQDLGTAVGSAFLFFVR